MGMKSRSKLSRAKRRRKVMTSNRPIKKRQKLTPTEASTSPIGAKEEVPKVVEEASTSPIGVKEEVPKVVEQIAKVLEEAGKVEGAGAGDSAPNVEERGGKEEAASVVSSRAPEVKLPRTDEEASAIFSNLHAEEDLVRFLELSQAKAAKRIFQLRSQAGEKAAQTQALHALLNCRRLVEMKLEMLNRSETGRFGPEPVHRSVEELVQTGSQLAYSARKELCASIITLTEVQEVLKHIDRELSESSKVKSMSSQPEKQMVQIYSLRAEVESRLCEIENQADLKLAETNSC